MENLYSRSLKIGQVKMVKRNRRVPISFKLGINIAIKVEVGDLWF